MRTHNKAAGGDYHHLRTLGAVAEHLTRTWTMGARSQPHQA